MKFVVSSLGAALLAFTAASADLTAQVNAPAEQPRPAAEQPAAQQPATPQVPRTQTEPQSQPRQTTEAQGQAQRSAGQSITITGCVQREADYRRARDAGRGGALGTGIGVGNEFVLVNASMGTSANAGAQAREGQPDTAVGTSGTLRGETAFELTGPAEGDAARFVGQRVEITGMLKETGATPGGPTAGAPPTGVDVTSEDLRLREIEVSAVRAASGECDSASR